MFHCYLICNDWLHTWFVQCFYNIFSCRRLYYTTQYVTAIITIIIQINKLTACTALYTHECRLELEWESMAVGRAHQCDVNACVSAHSHSSLHCAEVAVDSSFMITETQKQTINAAFLVFFLFLIKSKAERSSDVSIKHAFASITIK